MELIKITKAHKQLQVTEAMLEDSTIAMSCINGLQMQDVSATSLKIRDANLSDLEIFEAQLGGAYFHSIGLPPEGHPHYDANAKQRPLKFEDCMLEGSTFANCNLSDVSITNCELKGMTIDGIPVTELLDAYRGKQDQA